MSKKYIIHVDMDNTLCDFTSEYLEVQEQQPERQWPQSDPGFFLRLAPLANAIETYRWLEAQEIFDVWILTAPSVWNPLCYTEKRQWVGEHFDIHVAHKMIISPDKSLVKGDFLIDDYIEGKGQENFEGELIQFGGEAFPDWLAVKADFKRRFDLED